MQKGALEQRFIGAFEQRLIGAFDQGDAPMEPFL